MEKLTTISFEDFLLQTGQFLFLGPEVPETAGTEAVVTAQRHRVLEDLSAHVAGQVMFEKRVFFCHFRGGLDRKSLRMCSLVLKSLLINSRGGLYPSDSGGLQKINIHQHNPTIITHKTIKIGVSLMNTIYHRQLNIKIELVNY